MTDTTDIKALSNERLLEIKNILSGFEDGYDTVDDKENYEAMRGAQLIIDELISLRDQLEAERQRAADAQTLLMPDGLHENTKALVIGFANAMAEKLYKAEQKYGWSDAWMQSDWQDKCLTDFNHHITKGDPLDVANYCAFMHFHGWPTALKGDQVPVEYQMYYHNHGTGGGEWCRVRTKARYEELQIEHAGDNDFSFRTLFTAPQKPVVLDDATVLAWGDRNYIKGDVSKLRCMIDDAASLPAAIEATGGIVKDGE